MPTLALLWGVWVIAVFPGRSPPGRWPMRRQLWSMSGLSNLIAPHPIFSFSAKFNLSGNLTTTADGVNGTPANGRQDEIDAHAIATLFVHGDGIADGPYLSHGPRDIWGYFEEGVLSLTINPHIRENPPATIPVALLFPGGSDKVSGIVAWTLGVRAEVTVDDADVINHQAGSAIA